MVRGDNGERVTDKLKCTIKEGGGIIVRGDVGGGVRINGKATPESVLQHHVHGCSVYYFPGHSENK